LELSFKGQFCYIDAFTEPDVDENWNEEIMQETKEEHIERLLNSPLHLCRLRYFDKDKWGFAYYNYSDEKFKLATYPDGEFFGKLKMHFWLLLRFIDLFYLVISNNIL
jgi:hypothetical protein